MLNAALRAHGGAFVFRNPHRANRRLPRTSKSNRIARWKRLHVDGLADNAARTHDNGDEITLDAQSANCCCGLHHVVIAAIILAICDAVEKTVVAIDATL